MSSAAIQAPSPSSLSQPPTHHAALPSIITTVRSQPSPSQSPMLQRPSPTSTTVKQITSADPELIYSQATPERRKHRHQPPVAPPRTSSNQATSIVPPNSTNALAGAPENPRSEANTFSPHSDVLTANDMTEYASPNGRQRRYETGSGSPSARGSSTRVPGAGKSPSHEPSEILARMVISQPEIDYVREQERLAKVMPQNSHSFDDVAPHPVVPIGAGPGADDGRRGVRSRQDHSKREKVQRFGDYFLGNTIGEGEFGKVKLGWKKHGDVQVAIKLIRKDTVGNNPGRLQKIHREVQILKGLQHPNIVRLHEMSETERHIGIVLEYASGGELFDYILNHRYLKDQPARRLFAQLVSGVGYLHKKGIVHRDLKLENLLLDRNKNIIITDFGFANTFDPADELTEEQENSLTERDYVKRAGLDKVKPNGMRRGDLMQTSCGSPCYAAPELVVSDSLYTGRKVDVWSCGVILYAMLAGYLPFDDDPANPEGDNINLLYRYIVNTPLTFPEYVTPHARDLLRRILVPNPRKRADLFEVARHSWLSEFAHVVEFITSNTTTYSEIQNTTVPADEDDPRVARSLSVRESVTKASKGSPAQPFSRTGGVEAEPEAAARSDRDKKRQTVQVEYVAPNSNTRRGQPVTTPTSAKARPYGQGDAATTPLANKPLPLDPPSSRRYTNTNYGGVSSAPGSAGGMRPNTGESSKSRGRSSYGQPAPPTVANASAAGNIQQPSPRIPELDSSRRPSVSQNPPSHFDHSSPGKEQSPGGSRHGHKRSSTLGSLFGRSGSLLGRKKRGDQGEKPSRKYPPVSMSNHQLMDDHHPRPSVDSRASGRISAGFSKKRSGSITGSQTSQERGNRRHSLLKAIGLGSKDSTRYNDSYQDLSLQDPSFPSARDSERPTGSSRGYREGRVTPPSSAPPHQQRFPAEHMEAYSPSRPQPNHHDQQQGEMPVDQPMSGKRVSVGPHHRFSTSNADIRDQPMDVINRKSGRGSLQKNKHFNGFQGERGAAKRVMDFFRRRTKAPGGE